MSKKHFNELAAIMRKAQGAIDPVTYELMCNELASFCGRQSSTFNRHQFLTACGVR